MLLGILAAQLGAAAIVEETMWAQGEDPANVTIMEVEPDHWFLNEGAQRRMARAARNAEGDEILVIQKNPVEDVKPLVQHEVAHFLAWRRHGEGIKEHGSEFMKMCRKVVSERQSYYCRKE